MEFFKKKKHTEPISPPVKNHLPGTSNAYAPPHYYPSQTYPPAQDYPELQPQLPQPPSINNYVIPILGPQRVGKTLFICAFTYWAIKLCNAKIVQGEEFIMPRIPLWMQGEEKYNLIPKTVPGKVEPVTLEFSAYSVYPQQNLPFQTTLFDISGEDYTGEVTYNPWQVAPQPYFPPQAPPAQSQSWSAPQQGGWPPQASLDELEDLNFLEEAAPYPQQGGWTQAQTKQDNSEDYGPTPQPPNSQLQSNVTYKEPTPFFRQKIKEAQAIILIIDPIGKDQYKIVKPKREFPETKFCDDLKHHQESSATKLDYNAKTGLHTCAQGHRRLFDTYDNTYEPELERCVEHGEFMNYDFGNYVYVCKQDGKRFTDRFLPVAKINWTEKTLENITSQSGYFNGALRSLQRNNVDISGKKAALCFNKSDRYPNLFKANLGALVDHYFVTATSLADRRVFKTTSTSGVERASQPIIQTDFASIITYLIN